MLMTERTPLVPSLYPVFVQGERLCSLALRVEERMAAPSGMFWSLARQRARALHGDSATKAQGIDQLVELLTSLLGSEHVPAEISQRREEWTQHACPECADGQRAELSGPGPAVCLAHQRWTGPVRRSGPRRPDRIFPPHPAHGQRVTAEMSVAWENIERCLDARILSREDIYFVYDLIGIWCRGAPGAGPEPDDLPAAAAVAEVLHDGEFQRRWMDPGIPAQCAYRSLSELLAERLNAADKRLIDVVWLTARPTVAHLRGNFLQEPGSGPASPRVIARFTPEVVMRPLEPFSRYLALVDESGFDKAMLFPRTPAGILCRKGHTGKSFYGTSTEPVCPVCNHTRVVPGLNSIVEIHPAIAAQWVRPLNGKALTPETTGAGSNQRVLWVCPNGHEYPAIVANRTEHGSGCPVCTGQKVMPGVNDLSSTHPDIAAMLISADPTTLRPGSGSKQTWRCSDGRHTFERSVNSMVRLGGSCPFRTGRRIQAGENDLATCYPNIGAEWHPYRNGDLTPEEVGPGSTRLVWWLCPRGHDYQTPILRRTGPDKAGCTICSGRKLVSGVNDLATRYPAIARDWDAERNGMPAFQVVPGNQLRWWTCSHGHTQQHLLINRLRAGGCTLCEPEKRVASGGRKDTRGRQGWDKRKESLIS
jgi:hypothetical protein